MLWATPGKIWKCVLLAGLVGITMTESACDESECQRSTIGMTCKTYKEYVACLSAQSDSCTDTQSTEKFVIDSIVATSNAAMDLLNCNGVEGRDVSIWALIGSLLAILVKI